MEKTRKYERVIVEHCNGHRVFYLIPGFLFSACAEHVKAQGLIAWLWVPKRRFVLGKFGRLFGPGWARVHRYLELGHCGEELERHVAVTANVLV